MSAVDTTVGVFAPDSMMRRVMGERVVSYAYGMRASFVGALHPMAFIGTNIHTSAHGGAIYERMYRTALSFEALQLGDLATAEAEKQRVAALHVQVRGAIDRDLSPLEPTKDAHRAGERYSAYDPHQSFFTMAFLCESATTLYETFVAPLTPAERQAHYEDWITFGEWYGMKRSWAPDTWPEFLDTYHDYLTSDRAYLTRSARRAGLSLVTLSLPTLLRGMNELNYLMVVGTVPEHIREAYGTPWTARHEAEFRALRAALKGGVGRLPTRLRRGTLFRHLGPLADMADRQQRERAAARGSRPNPNAVKVS